MKMFEEWWSKNHFGKNHTPGPKEVWNAALKMVLKRLNDDYERVAPGDTGWMGGFIEEELGQKAELLKDD